MLAALPPGKGRGVNWASQPAPELLEAIMHFAGHGGSSMRAPIFTPPQNTVMDCHREPPEPRAPR